MATSLPVREEPSFPLELLVLRPKAPSGVGSGLSPDAHDSSGDAASSTPDVPGSSEDTAVGDADGAVTPPTIATKRQWITSNGINALLAILVSCFAVAAYIAQMKANQLSEEANRLSYEALKEQLWRDCQDQGVRCLNLHQQFLTFF